jgi:hypothetical protein
LSAPLGNNNATKNKRWREALDRAIAQDDGKRLRAAAEKLLDLAEAGEAWAVKELGDRLDGKAAQTISGEDGNPIPVRLIIGA